MKTIILELDYSGGCPEVQAEDQAEAAKLNCTLTFKADGSEMRHAVGVLQGTHIAIKHFLRLIYFVSPGNDPSQDEYYCELIAELEELK